MCQMCRGLLELGGSFPRVPLKMELMSQMVGRKYSQQRSSAFSRGGGGWKPARNSLTGLVVVVAVACG